MKQTVFKLDVKICTLNLKHFYNLLIILWSAYLISINDNWNIYYVNNYIDWNQFNTLYNDLFLKKNRQAAEYFT